MNIMEIQFRAKEKAPDYCSYCDEDKTFLMAKPTAYAVKGELFVNINQTKETLWMCLECLETELDAAGVSVSIEEYE